MSGYQTKLAVFCMVIALNIQCTLTGILFANITFGTLNIDICASHCFLLSYNRIVMAAEGDQLSVTENVADVNISIPSADSESYLKDDLMCIKCRDPVSRNEEMQEVQRGLKTLINYVLKFGNDALVQYLQNKHATGGKARIHQQ